MIIEEEFFEHHGAKGQKWGIRHPPKKGSFRALPKSTQHKIIVGTVGITVVVGGAAMAAAILRNNGHLKFMDLGRAIQAQRGRARAQQLLAQPLLTRKFKASEVRNMNKVLKEMTSL